MTNPLNTLHHINGLRHNFILRALYDARNRFTVEDFANMMAKEMGWYCESLLLLRIEDFKGYAEWFAKNTPPTILAKLQPLMAEIFEEAPPEEVVEEIDDADQLPF